MVSLWKSIWRAGRSAKKQFLKFIHEKYPNKKEMIKRLPDFSVYDEDAEFVDDKTLLRFLEYNSVAIADDICYFEKVIKDRINRRLIAGSFYGYTMEVFEIGHVCLFWTQSNSTENYIFQNVIQEHKNT